MKAIYIAIPFVATLALSSCATSLNLAYEDDLYAEEQNIYIAQVDDNNVEGQDDYYDPNYSDVYKSDYYSDDNVIQDNNNFHYYGSPNAGFYNSGFNPYFGSTFYNSYNSYNAWGTPYNNYGYNSGFNNWNNPYCVGCGGYGYNPYGNTYNSWGTPYNNYGNGYYSNGYGYNPYYGTYNPYYGNPYNGNNNNFANSDSPQSTGGHRGSAVSSNSRYGSSYRFSNSISNNGGTSTTTNSGNNGYSHVIPSGMKAVDTPGIESNKPAATEYKPNYNSSISSIGNAEKGYKRTNKPLQSASQPNRVSSTNNSAWNSSRRPTRSNSSSANSYRETSSRPSSVSSSNSRGNARASTYKGNSSRNYNPPTRSNSNYSGSSRSSSSYSRPSSGSSRSSGSSSKSSGSSSRSGGRR